MTAPKAELPKDVVPPGNQTGDYYIPISNLPWNTTWQGLKDFIKPVCTVQHVEVFSKSTSGWIKVKGHRDFRAVFDYLNSREYRGRAIIADGRNEFKPLKVRDLQAANPPGSTNRPSTSTARAPAATPAHESPLHATDGAVSNPDATVLASPTPTTASVYGGQGNNGHSMSSWSPLTYMTTPDTSFSHAVTPNWNPLPEPTLPYGYGSGPGPATPQSFYSFPAVSDGQTALYNHSASYAVQPYSGYYTPATTRSVTSQLANLTVGTSSTGGGGGGGSSTSSRVVYTEQRGVHIRDLSRRASEDQVRKMIREAAGREANLISRLEIPLDKNRSPRGWAFVHYRSADLARRMVVALDGLEFKGRKLQVRLLKEGEVVGFGVGAAGSSKDHRGARHGDRRDDGGRREKDRGERGGAQKPPPPFPDESGPVVPGSGTAAAEASLPDLSKDKDKDKDKGKGKGKGKGKERKERCINKSSVVIADGSSMGRR